MHLKLVALVDYCTQMHKYKFQSKRTINNSKKFLSIVILIILLDLINIMKKNNAIAFKNDVQYYAHKEAWTFPSLEDLHTGERYALTIHPKDMSDSYYEFHHNLHSTVLKYFPHYYLLPELSTKNQRWHVHGTCWFNSGFEIVQFYKHIKDIKEECTFCLKKIEEPVQWYLYCIKQRHLVAPYLCQIFDNTSSKKYVQNTFPKYKIIKQ